MAESGPIRPVHPSWPSRKVEERKSADEKSQRRSPPKRPVPKSEHEGPDTPHIDDYA